MEEDRYYSEFAAAAVRGRLIRSDKTEKIEGSLIEKDIYSMTSSEKQKIFDIGIIVFSF